MAGNPRSAGARPLAANSQGEYWLDNANTEKYSGWNWVMNLSVG
ncbi:MAG: hypothetical protein R3E34_01845 [Rhodocyclaceae bacterium]